MIEPCDAARSRFAYSSNGLVWLREKDLAGEAGPKGVERENFYRKYLRESLQASCSNNTYLRAAREFSPISRTEIVIPQFSKMCPVEFRSAKRMTGALTKLVP